MSTTIELNEFSIKKWSRFFEYIEKKILHFGCCIFFFSWHGTSYEYHFLISILSLSSNRDSLSVLLPSVTWKIENDRQKYKYANGWNCQRMIGMNCIFLKKNDRIARCTNKPKIVMIYSIVLIRLALPFYGIMKICKIECKHIDLLHDIGCLDKNPVKCKSHFIYNIDLNGQIPNTDLQPNKMYMRRFTHTVFFVCLQRYI